MATTFFKRFRMHFDLTRSLPDLQPLPPGYRVLPWRDDLVTRHAQAKFDSFRHEMDANVFPCLGQFDGCLRLMKEISSRPNFVPEATWLIEYRGRQSGSSIACGTVQGLSDADTIGSIQNLGVVPAHRGHGLGRYLLTMALEGFRKHRFKIASLEVTAQNRSAYRLYQQFGFRPVKTVYKTLEMEAS